MALCFVGNTIGQKVMITGITIVGGAKLYFPKLFIPMLREDVLKGQPLSVFALLFPGTIGLFAIWLRFSV
jgi:hypothetical protein